MISSKERLQAVRAAMDARPGLNDSLVQKVRAVAAKPMAPVSQYWQANNDMGSGNGDAWGALNRPSDDQPGD